MVSADAQNFCRCSLSKKTLQRNTNFSAQGPVTSVIKEGYNRKILHTGNTRPFCHCLIQEYRYYTMSLSQHHGWGQHQKSISIPWFLVNTISLFSYHNSLSIPWFHVYAMSPCLNRESMSIPWVIVKSILQDYRNTSDFWIMGHFWVSPCLYHESLSNPCFHFCTMRNTVFLLSVPYFR